MRRLLYVFIGTFLLIAGEAQAQLDRASLTGTVKDSTGAVIPNATVTITGPQAPATTTTNAEGTYLVLSLVPGRYVVVAESAGFQKSSRAVILEVGQKGRVDFTLGVGVTETVTVEAATRLLNTEQSSLGTVMDQGKVANLPLAIRNWDDLLALVPGVQGDRFTEQGGGTSFGRTGGVNVHGARSLQNNFLLDGVDNNSISENVQELTSQVSRPSVDAIQEFKVVTSPYSAEYGRSPGAAVSVTTKSGTNEFHGTAYDFYRNEKFDSNDFLSKRANQPKPSNDQNQFGGNVGGPIVKDKAYFFLDYEGTRITRGVTRVTNVPTAAQRQGIFSSTVRDPLTGQPFPNNTIPAGRIDPTAAAILALVPLPNQSGANNFFRAPDLTDDNDRVLGRLDFKLSQNDNVFARYIWSNRQRNIPGAFGGILDGTGTSAFGNQTIKTNGVVAGWTRIFSATVVNELRFNWQQAKSDAVQQPFGQQPTGAALVRNSITDPIVAGGLPGITIDGFFGGPGLGRLGSPDFLPKFQHTNQYEFLDTISWLKGNHALKLGGDVIVMKNEYVDIPAVRGAMNFRNRFTGQPLGDFLLGYVSDFQLSNVFVVDQRHWASMFFVQDDWKVGSKLSLNLGLRYDFITPALEAENHQANFVPEGGGSLVLAKDGSLEDRGLVKPDRNNFAPRVGFVYKIDDRMLVRGGYGVFYNLFDRVGSEDQLALNPPGLTNNSVSSSNTAPVFFLRDGFPSGFLNPPSLDPARGDLRRLRIRAVTPDAPKTTIQQASIGFQRELVRNVVLSVDGVWTKGTNLASLINLNQPLPNAAGTGVGSVLPYPNFGFIEYRQQNGRSTYKGLDFGLEKRFSDGFGFGVAYTLGDSKDNTSEHLTTQGSNSFPQNSRNLDDWYGPSDYDVRHRLAVNFVAELPFGTGKKWAQEGVGRAILGGWTFSGIYALRSGRPFTVNQGGNNVGQNMTGLPNLVGDPAGAKTIDQWFNPAAFQAVASGTFGNTPRNNLRGPRWQSCDMTLSRGLHVSSRVLATLRWDVFNLFNTTNLGLPNRNVTSLSTLGTISSLAGDARVMQLSVRLGF
jgi:Carboxypeptidase regulatory-like domain/TonB dependent receptor/TonB-dependent Receptor Plug Domain